MFVISERGVIGALSRDAECCDLCLPNELSIYSSVSMSCKNVTLYVFLGVHRPFLFTYHLSETEKHLVTLMFTRNTSIFNSSRGLAIDFFNAFSLIDC